MNGAGWLLKWSAALFASLALTACQPCAGIASTNGARPHGNSALKRDGISEIPGAGQEACVMQSHGISYHGGKVLTGSVPVHFLFYGTWEGSDVPGLLSQLIHDLDRSPYLKINSTYWDQNVTRVTGNVRLGTVAFDAASRGRSLGEKDLRGLLEEKIANGTFPLDENAVYFIFSDAHVGVEGFCQDHCGWHDHAPIRGANLHYGFVGSSARCRDACAPQAVGPNGDGVGDAMASMLAHELSEALTDPELNAWYDGEGEENADKCAWQFGTTWTAAKTPQALANVQMNGHEYYLQQNWSNGGEGSCRLAL